MTGAEPGAEVVRLRPPLRVVLIDDTPDIRLLVKVALDDHGGFEVVGEAGDGAEGVEVVRRERPDLVVLDLAMPVMDGLEALGHIARVSPATRTVVLSAFTAQRMRQRVLTSGAVGYVQKGSSARRVVAEICRAVGVPEAPVPQPGRAAPPRAEVPVVVAVPAGAPAADTVATPSRRHRGIPDRDTAELARIHEALAGAAHELRGPATVLLAMSELLSVERESIDPVTFGRMLDAIARQAQVLDRVTGDLLTSTQSQRGVLTVAVEPLALRPLAEAAGLTLAARHRPELDVDAGLTVLADPTRVQQMLTNLLSNALKYGAAPITVRALADRARVVVRVEDRGDGVPPGFRDALFQQFTRAPSARAGGMGLGLFVVRSLARAHGGDAWYEPRPGGGSAFCFSLPAAEPGTEPGPGPAGDLLQNA